MASSCPVVISDCCKFPEVAEHGAGIIVPLSVSQIAAGLGVYAGSAAQRLAAGQAARQLIVRRYTWEIVAQQAAKMYATIAARESD
jgi:glycosyltransferase involved in cell wall biosynthesis